MAGQVHLVIPSAGYARDSRHQCPIGGCVILLPASKLMCKGHWFTAPKRLRDAVNDAYAYGAGVGSLSLLQAQQAAIDAVEKKLAKETGS